MGMYTGLRAKVVVKPEWRAAIAVLHEDVPAEWFPGCRWGRVFHAHPSMPGVGRWVRVGRRDFIPFGSLAYMPDDFSDAEDGESYSRFDPVTGLWEFCCSLKNYEDEIEQFVTEVLAHIVDRVFWCERLYEQYPLDDYTGKTWRDWTIKYLEPWESENSAS